MPFGKNPKKKKPGKKPTGKKRVPASGVRGLERKRSRLVIEHRALKKGIGDLHKVIRLIKGVQTNNLHRAKIDNLYNVLVKMGVPRDLEGLMRRAELLEINCRDKLRNKEADFAVSTKAEVKVLQDIGKVLKAVKEAKRIKIWGSV